MRDKDTSKSDSLVQYCNCRILRDHHIIKDDLWVRDGKIQDPEKIFFDERIVADSQIDCKDVIIAPGYIDLQINGAFGVDFSSMSENVEDSVTKVARALLSHGVTSFIPTIVTSPSDVYKQILPQMSKREGGRSGAGVLGIHLEGPFISEDKRGAHLQEQIQPIRTGIPDLTRVYGSLHNVSIVTLAPELQHASDVISYLVSKGIVVSVGHSTANLSEGEAAVKAGASFITHLFNAMLPFHHRDPHLVGLLASDEVPGGRRVYYGMIADGVHTHPSALRIAYRAHPQGLVLVTDAIPAMGLSTGVHHIGSQSIEIKNQRAVLAGTDTLCGSIASLDTCVRYFYKAVDCSQEEAIEAATLHPAQVLGIADRKGTLDYGADADFIMLNDALHVQATYIAGNLVWQGDNQDTNSVLT